MSAVPQVLIENQWKPGQSGNPTGRPRIIQDLAKLARVHTNDALDKIYAVMMREDTPPMAVLKAAELLLERGWGKAPQVIELRDEDGETVQLNTLEVARKVAFLLAAAAREMNTIEHKGNGDAGA